MTPDTRDFLAALTFSAGEDNPILDANPSCFSAPFVEAVGQFCSAFREYLESLGLDPDSKKDDRDFGADVYFSLSGHGVGFWDDSGPWGDVLQAALENFSGRKYRFEDLAWKCSWTGEEPGEGEISGPIEPLAIPDVANLPPLELHIAYCPDRSDLRVHSGPAEKFVSPPYWEGLQWSLEPFTPDLFEGYIREVPRYWNASND